jgi:hypothetical protein
MGDKPALFEPVCLSRNVGQIEGRILFSSQELVFMFGLFDLNKHWKMEILLNLKRSSSMGQPLR